MFEGEYYLWSGFVAFAHKTHNSILCGSNLSILDKFIIQMNDCFGALSALPPAPIDYRVERCMNSFASN
jgi:hypothetical protein